MKWCIILNLIDIIRYKHFNLRNYYYWMKMAELITKSNALKKRLDEKKKELKDLDDSIKAFKFKNI